MVTGPASSTVPAGHREPAPEVRLKVHADDGTYLGSVNPSQAELIINNRLGQMQSGYIRLVPRAWRGSVSLQKLFCDGMRTHDRDTRDNPRGVWTFRKRQG